MGFLLVDLLIQSVSPELISVLLPFQTRSLCVQWVQDLPWTWQNYGQS